mmetsp:Transcript_8160/g.20387  ORF Transcript_8160/g.20387 Transcript_8160/m.20387 type:complete len:214 (-) Transcript_8160:1699-2340(-)
MVPGEGYVRLVRLRDVVHAAREAVVRRQPGEGRLGPVVNSCEARRVRESHDEVSHPCGHKGQVACEEVGGVEALQRKHLVREGALQQVGERCARPAKHPQQQRHGGQARALVLRQVVPHDQQYDADGGCGVLHPHVPGEVRGPERPGARAAHQLHVLAVARALPDQKHGVSSRCDGGDQGQAHHHHQPCCVLPHSEHWLNRQGGQRAGGDLHV